MDHMLYIFNQLSSFFGLKQEDGLGLEKQLNARPDSAEMLMKLAIYYHDRGIEGDKDAVQKSEKYLKQVLEKNADQAIALAYLGSVYTLMGRDSTMFWKKMKYVQEGLAKIDRAIEMAPNDLAIRMIRMMNSLNLPAFLNRRHYYFRDLEYVTAQKEFVAWPEEQKALLFFCQGLAFKIDQNQEQAQKCFETSKTIAPQSRWALLAHTEMINS